MFCSFKLKGKNMKKTVSLLSVLALGACVYGTPVNNEGFYGEMDITNVDWSEVNASGSSCQTNWLFFIPAGDNSVPAAVKNAKIKKLSYVDTDYALYFPLLSRECTNVWGVKELMYGLPDIPETTTVKPAKVATPVKADKKTPAKATKTAAAEKATKPATTEKVAKPETAEKAVEKTVTTEKTAAPAEPTTK